MMENAHRLRVNFLLAGALLLAALVVSTFSSWRESRAEREASALRALLVDLNGLRASVADAEVEQRNYLLTGDASRYNAHRRQVDQSIALLDRFTGDGAAFPQLHRALRELDQDTRLTLGELDHAASLHAARPVSSATLTDVAIERNRQLLSGVIEAQHRHVHALDVTAARAESINAAACIGGTLFALLVAVYSGLRTLRGLQLHQDAKQILRQSEARLREAEEIAVPGNFRVDLRTMETRWSSDIYFMFQIDPTGAPLTIDQYLQTVHPEDRNEVEISTARVIREGGSYDLRYRIVLASGDVRHLRSRASVHRDADGAFPRLVGTLTDITEPIRLFEALRESEANVSAFMDNSPALAFIKDRDGHFIYMNRVCQQMWNFDKTGWYGKTDVELFSAEIAAELRVRDKKVLDDNAAHSNIESIPLPGGGSCSLLTYKFPMMLATGDRGLAGMSIDISAQLDAEKRALDALDEREVLLREIHHRVKNNLQVICSLLGMQASNSDDPATVSALLTSQDRVRSMALIHELLYGAKTLGDIDFAHYVEQLVLQISASLGLDSSRISLRLDAAPMRFDVDRAIPCGLILNELISNAFKHAFPGKREGEIVVRIGSSGEDEIFLAVDDDGVGLPKTFELKNTRSLGLRVVQILARQIDGAFHVNRGTGSSFEVRFPRAVHKHEHCG